MQQRLKQVVIVIAASIATLFSVATLAQSNQIPDGLFFKGTVKEAKAKAKQTDSRIMIITSATYCAPCKVLAAKVYPTPEFKQFKDNNKLIMLYYPTLDKADPERIIKTFGVGAHPSFIFLNSKGEEFNRWVGGANNTAELTKVMDEMLDESNSFAAKKAQLKKDPSYAYAYIQYYKNSFKRYEVEDELYALLKKGPLKNYFTDQWWKYYYDHGNYIYSGIVRYMVEQPKKVIKVIGQEKYNAFMQDRGLRLIAVNIGGSNKRYDIIRPALDFISQHPQLETKVSQFFRKNIDLVDGGDGVELFKETLPWLKDATTAERRILFQVSFGNMRSLERKEFEGYMKRSIEECLKYETDEKAKSDYEKMLASLKK